MTDAQLINAISRADAEAIDFVIAKYSRLVWRIAASVLDTAPEQDIEECVADVFVYLWEHSDKYDPCRGSLKTWLSVTAKSRAIDRYRELARRQDLPLEETLAADRADHSENIIRGESRDDILSAVNSLGEPEREIVLRRFFYEQKPREISLALHIPVKSVDNYLYRAKQKLRSFIENK